MKELSIEEKAKAYDEALKVLHKYDGANIMFTQDLKEEMFPELREPEDEKIRKSIIAIINNYVDNSNTFKPKMIAWLEKQGEQKEINLVEILKHYPKETELYSPLYGKLWFAEVDEENEIITCYKYPLNKGCTRAILEQEDTVSFYSDGTIGLPDFSVSKDCMLFLYDIEKRGEQKPATIDIDKMVNDYANNKERGNKEFGKPVNCMIRAYRQGLIDAIGKVVLKPADRVKLMFKVGDWIIYDRHISKVKDMDSEGYLVEDTYGDEGILPKEFAEKHYHLWTIAEAKDGDVLFMDNGSANCIFIYKSSNNGIINKYASYNKFGFEGEHYLVLNDGYVIPATKEQRGLLFQKMHEAGYEWDTEKKELILFRVNKCC